MKQQKLKKLAKTPDRRTYSSVGVAFLIALCGLSLTGCSELRRPKVEPFYAVTGPPPQQELRWSNGKSPKSFDPAQAFAAPETDIVRAAYEGLTDLDSKSLREIPGVAENWDSSNDLRTWTFHLRKDALWSNGERVTAKDFVGSWKRLIDVGNRTVYRHLVKNIVGMDFADSSKEAPSPDPNDFLRQTPLIPEANVKSRVQEANILPRSQLAAQIPAEQKPEPETTPGISGNKAAKKTPLGVEALDDQTLKVTLVLPDKDFPKLVSHPIFRPVFAGGSNFEKPGLDPETVTNGAFQITKVDAEGITLERSEKYWNRDSVALGQVRFVPKNSAEAALEAYRKGEVDVVTNAAFEPLALKLLTPYDDFRRTAHNALNFYEFNVSKEPFSDRRIREALAIAIDRAKLTEGDLDGSNQPAHTFFPSGEPTKESISLDTGKAKDLLEKAGYADGKGFPTIRLVVNRNDTQQRVARAVARMWKQNLNLETEIIVKESAEIELVKRSLDYDLLRRGVVLPTNDELVNLQSVLGSARKISEKPAIESKPNFDSNLLIEKQRPLLKSDEPKGGPSVPFREDLLVEKDLVLTQTEEDAIFELKAIPLYFPMSYSLVKPYVRGFEINGLDAPSLREVSIDNSWQPNPRGDES